MGSRRTTAQLLVFLSSSPVFAAPPTAAPPAASAAPGSTASETKPAPVAPRDRGESMRAYHAALARRQLGGSGAWRAEMVKEAAAKAEELGRAGRTDEAIALLVPLVEDPRFEPFAEDEDGRAALYRLGDALARAGISDAARPYLRKSLRAKKAWEGRATYAALAVRRLVDVALETDAYGLGIEDLRDLPRELPEETRGEVAYLSGRAKEAEGNPDGALAAYREVSQRSRFWSSATYLQGLILVEKGRHKEAEDLFCKVADPKRHDRSTPVFADERFFAVRDLARLALGRVAHEHGRFDDARYYYYLVPRDSERLAEALYEASTGRYEKKDYDGARELLDDLKALQIHHRYEDEVWVFDAYLDLAQCRFEDADKKLRQFLARYEPVRDGARRVVENERALQALLLTARAGGDPVGAESGAASRDELRAIAALVRVDPAYGAVLRRRAVLERQVSGLRQTRSALSDMGRSLATNGGVRPSASDEGDADPQKEARLALDGIRTRVEMLEANHASDGQTKTLREDLSTLESKLREASATPAPESKAAGNQDLPDLLRADETLSLALLEGADKVRKDLATEEARLAKDAIHRLDLRLSRLLRRARLGRIESVLGRKRALEVEIEAINNGFLPRGAVDSLDAHRFLKDNEEYWPFEGDDWPDEFVGSEGLK